MKKTIILATVFAFAPCLAFADVGTPLVWATGFQRVFGNAILGVLEGWVLAKAFKLPRGRCIGILILANYFSAWIGMFIVDALRASQTVDIYNAQQVSLLLVLLTYLFTLLIEWPFVAFCFLRSPGWFGRSVRASFLVQTLSYLLLFSFFWSVSGRSLYSDFSIVPGKDISLPPAVSVYFISRDDGDVYRRSHRHERELVARLASTNVWSFLRLQRSQTNTNAWDLVAVLDLPRGHDAVIPIVAGVTTNLGQEGWKTQEYYGWGSAPQVGAATNSTWHFSWGHWPTIGVYGENKRTGEHLRVAFGNPIMGWVMWRAIHLPGDKVLFQLGEDQLCLLDVAERKVGLWDRGHGPVAISQDDSSNIEPALPPPLNGQKGTD